MINPRRLPRPIIIALALLLWSAWGKPLFASSASGSSSPYRAGLKGEVRDSLTGLPVAGARVTLPGLGIEAATGDTGQFAWEAIALDRLSVPVTITVSASGFGDWTATNVLLAADDTLLLTAELKEIPVRMVLPDPESVRPPANFSSKTAPRLPIDAEFTIPSTIRVRMTGKWQCDAGAPYTVATVDFKDYVKHVLPNEWYYFWPRESLKAGAVAVKTYAWYFIEQGGKWDDADLLDNTCDQWYVPFISRESTNRAVDETWHWLMTRDGQLFPAYHKEIDACDPPKCIRQSVSAQLARNGLTWDKILERFYGGVQLTPLFLPPTGYALLFHGLPNDGLLANRLMLRVADAEDPEANFPLNIGGGDFTIEWWMKATAAENRAAPLHCGSNENWIFGNILLDRFRPDKQPGFGVSLAGGAPAFGVTGPSRRSLTICASRPVVDGKWHHVAVQRRASDGYLWIFVDGKPAAEADGPGGDIRFPSLFDSSYPDREPFLSIGGWKMDPDLRLHPFYRGRLDEVRFSQVLRYSAAFDPPQEPFQPDDATLALFHFDQGIGDMVSADAGATDGSAGFSEGSLLYGGQDSGPEWVLSNLFIPTFEVFLPSVKK